MPEHEPHADDRPGTHDEAVPDVLIVVVRSGGFAGLSRRWRVEPSPAEQAHWTTLVDRCPWHDPIEQADAGADRFTWTLEARTPEARLQRQLPESAVTGAWRELVDAVRAASAPGA